MEDVVQAIALGIASGSTYAIAAVGLTLVYGILRLTNFAHGDFLTFGMYAAWLVTVHLAHLPLVVGMVVAAVATAVLSVVGEFTIWRPLRRRRAGLLQLLLMSIGLAFVVRYGLQLAFGSRLQRLDVDQLSTVEVVGISLSTVQVWTIATAAVVLVVVGLLLSRTMLGKQMRALSDNFELAESSGIDTDRVIVATWVLAGALAGIGGVLAAMQLNIRPETGFTLLLSLFAAVILGGIGNAYGALLGGYILGIVQELSVTTGVDTRYKPAVGFVVLILVLLMRPQGLLGARRAVN